MAGKESVWERRVMMAGLLLLTLLVLGVGYRLLRDGFGGICDDFMYPYLRLARVGTARISDQSLLALSRGELAEKASALQERNAELSIRAARTESLEKENIRLRRIAGYLPPPKWSTVKAEIIKRDPMKFRERFTLDRGAADGVVAGAAVVDIGDDGQSALLIGVIERVGTHSSTVMTLCSRGLRLSAQLGGSAGFVNAGSSPRGDGLIPIGYLRGDVRHTVGEPVRTTGFEHGIPAGLLIGELSSIDRLESKLSNPLHVSGRLRPAADFDRLRLVTVVVPQDGQGTM